ncbi:MAG TPA: NAD(P)/FAD-dependent oxidoreductase, partial [Nitrososphaeraceae archaeon]
MSPEKYEVLVAGGSVAGLFVARELAAKGISVIVLEKDHEIGTPEHCSGVVSVQGLNKLGVIPDSDVIQNFVTKAQISCLSSQITLNAENQNVAVIDRRLFDKQIAKQAQSQGAIIRTRSAFRAVTKNDSNTSVVKTSDGELQCHYIVDARGVGALVSKNKTNIMPSAQFEIYADWISGKYLEVRFDAE